MPKIIDLHRANKENIYDPTAEYVTLQIPYKGELVPALMDCTTYWGLFLNECHLRIKKVRGYLYVQVYRPGTDGYRYLHRMVCPELDADPTLEVHHVNQGPYGTLDNRRAMLRPMPRAEHRKIHHQRRTELKAKAKEAVGVC